MSGNVKLKALMTNEKLSQRELSRRSGVSQPTIHRMLSGLTLEPTYSTAQALANYFAVTPADIYAG